MTWRRNIICVEQRKILVVIYMYVPDTRTFGVVGIATSGGQSP